MHSTGSALVTAKTCATAFSASCCMRMRCQVLADDCRVLSGVEPNVQTYTALVSVCSHAGQFAQALSTLQAMDVAGVQPDVVAFNSVIAACADQAHWEAAWSVMAGMRRCGTTPTVVSYNLLLSACERAGQAERALEVFGRMQRDAASMPCAPCLCYAVPESA